MNPSAMPEPMNSFQIRLLLELLQLHHDSPDRAIELDRLIDIFGDSRRGEIERLMGLDEHDVPDALYEFADDDAREIVRNELAHEARLSFVAA